MHLGTKLTLRAVSSLRLVFQIANIPCTSHFSALRSRFHRVGIREFENFAAQLPWPMVGLSRMGSTLIPAFLWLKRGDMSL